MTELDRIAGLYVIPLAALFLTATIVCIGIVCIIYLRTIQYGVKNNRNALAEILKKQDALMQEMERRSQKHESFMRELTHDHKAFERFLEDFKKSTERIENNTATIKESQASWISKNENAANGNKVKVYSGKENQEAYQTTFLNYILEQLVDKLQDRNTAPPNRPQ